MISETSGAIDRASPADAGPAAPKFLITIDTEGDNLWSRPKTLTTENARFLPRFQSLCESYGMKPTYLTNYEMVCCSAFVEFAKDALDRSAAEIGMHLHAWDTPHEYQVPAGGGKYHPYLIEYPEQVMRDMIATVTDLLEDAFGVKMLSHRSGRWAFNGVYAKLLLERDYTVDCSVTPHVSWREHIGAPDGQGGSDYRGYPDDAYYLDLEDISRPGDSNLLEVPMTIVPCQSRAANWIRRRCREGSIPARAIDKFFPPIRWLRPNGENLGSLLSILRWARRADRDYVEFMLHSSELMPGGSPKFTTVESIDNLYEDMEALFAAAGEFQGATLTEYRRIVEASSTAAE